MSLQIMFKFPSFQKVFVNEESVEGGNPALSSTESFMAKSPCQKEENGYYKQKCVGQKCKECKDLKPAEIKIQNSEKVRKVSQFEVTKTPYKKKVGEEIVEKISEKNRKGCP